VTTDTILQKRVPDALLGRVFSVRFMGFSVGEVLAYSAGGAIVDVYGVRLTYLLAGVATATAGLFVLFFLTAASMKSIQNR